MKYEFRLTISDVRRVCIDNHYYTNGDNSAYNEMFEMVSHKNVTADILEKVATNIKEHSKTGDTVKDIMELLSHYITILIK